MQLRFDPSQIRYYASQYNVDYDTPIEEIAPQVTQRGYLTKSDLIELVTWLRNRRKDLVEKISERRVQEITGSALASTSDSIRYLFPKKLQGVGIATASAILHWFHEDDYPISSPKSKKAIQFDLNESEDWEAYVLFFQNTTRDNNVDPRTLDRALCRWTYLCG